MTLDPNRFEQSDGSLYFPGTKRIITQLERKELITNSINTPVRLREKDIKDIIKDSSVSILIGETGSGKTTELAQMIHEEFPNDMVVTNIPLVSATMGTATFVSDIMCAKTGNPYYTFKNGGVGYRTGKGVSSDDRSQISFNTYGLDYLHLSLGNYENFLNSGNKNIHIILDEIHEKSEDFVFYLSKIIELSKKYPGRIKLYGASATVSDDYLNILVDKFKDISKEVPVTKVEGRTFPVEVIEDNGASVTERAKKLWKEGKSILIFESGKGEIERTINALKLELGIDIDIIPFHSEVSKEELDKNLKSTGEQKIIVATNAARTGVTLDVNAVVDAGKQKSQYYDENGIAILKSEDITHDAYMQNRGRVGRKEKGIAEYTGSTPIDELEIEAPSSVEIKVDEKKILMELIDGNNILKNESTGIHKYLFNPNKRMLNFSYKWMKSAGLITKDEKITKYGYDSLKFPLSVFNGRIILEAIENKVAKEVIPMVAIMENRGFLTKEFDIKKFKKNILKANYSDLEIYVKLFEILTSKEVDEVILRNLNGLGISGNLIDYFRSLNGEEKLYKIIGDELNSIGIKLKNIERIDETIEKIKKYLEYNKDYINSLNVDELDEDKKKMLIQKSLLSGNLHNIFVGIGKDRLSSYYSDQTDLEFEKSDTSFMQIGSGELYIGEPFIIGGTGDKDDKSIFSFLTLIEAGDIEHFESKNYREYKIKKADKVVEEFTVDVSGDTFFVPNQIKNNEDKQKYLALNWLPNFLLNKNPYFKNFIQTHKNDLDKDDFLRIIEEFSLDLFKELDPTNKEVNVDKFKKDKIILGLVLQSKKLKEILSGDKSEKLNTKKDVEISEKKSEFYDYVTLVNTYNKTLEEAQNFINKYYLDTDLFIDNILNDFITSLELYNEDYKKILFFIKNLNKTKANNKLKENLKQSFNSYVTENKKLIELKKRNSWLISFVNNLEELRKGKKIDIKEFSIGTIDDKKLLLSDPIIVENKLGEKTKFLQGKFKNIKKLIRKTDLNQQEDILITSLQRLLSSDTRKFNRGLKAYEGKILEITEIKNNYLAEINNLNSLKNSLNAETTNKRIKELNILNSNLGLLLDNLEIFKNKILEIREIIKEINFNDIIFNMKKKNSIYTKKFLYNLLIDNIFEGNFIVLANKQENKLIERLNKNIKLNSNIFDSYRLVELIKNINSGNHIVPKIQGKKNDINNDKFNSPYLELDNYISKIKELLVDYKKENETFEGSISKNHSDIVGVIGNIEGILLGFYPKEILELHENKIFNFSKKIYNISTYDIDKEIKKLITSLPLEKNNQSQNDLEAIIKYKDLRENILQLEKTETNIEDNKDNDFSSEIELLNISIEDIKQKTKKIKKFIDLNNKNN